MINSNSYRFGVIAAYCSNFGHFAFLSHPLVILGSTYDVYLGLIGKRVVDFLLVLIDFFFARCYGWVAIRAKRDRECTYRRSTSVSLVGPGAGGSPGCLHLWHAKSSEYQPPHGKSQAEAANLKLYTAISHSQQAMRLPPTWLTRLRSAVRGNRRSTVWENIEQPAPHTVPVNSTTIRSNTEL